MFTVEDLAKALSLIATAGRFDMQYGYEPYTRTLRWVERSCLEDGLPEHLIAAVLVVVQQELRRGTFPIVASEEVSA
jgi:hypothetical protein